MGHSNLSYNDISPLFPVQRLKKCIRELSLDVTSWLTHIFVFEVETQPRVLLREDTGGDESPI